MNNVMLYKHPGKHKIHGDKFDYIIVDEKDVNDALIKGWFKTTPEALNASKGKKSDSKPNSDDREELLEEAKELGIDFHPNIGIGKLKQRIQEAKAG